jgi:hypothetical protein
MYDIAKTKSFSTPKNIKTFPSSQILFINIFKPDYQLYSVNTVERLRRDHGNTPMISLRDYVICGIKRGCIYGLMTKFFFLDLPMGFEWS